MARELLKRWSILIILIALPAIARDRIWDIEFFGYKGIDLEAVRKTIPVREGDDYSGDETKKKVQQAVSDALGRDATDVAGICCNENGDQVLFIGLPGASSKRFTYNPAPKGTARLSDEITALNDRLNQALEAAVRKGGDAAREDDSTGYALAHDSAARSLQLKLREYALAHEGELLSVLKSSADPKQRATAANALGYAHQSSRQIGALVRAARDPDDDVRNDAIRALGVLASSDHRPARQIPAANFIDMINSGVWRDRNKGSFLLLELTRGRNPDLLAALRTRALDSLIEISKWRSVGHALAARFVLGRIAGIPEERLQQLVSGPLEPILDALPHP
jgi:hypothetical protein